MQLASLAGKGGVLLLGGGEAGGGGGLIGAWIMHGINPLLALRYFAVMITWQVA